MKFIAIGTQRVIVTKLVFYKSTITAVAQEMTAKDVKFSHQLTFAYEDSSRVEISVNTGGELHGERTLTQKHDMSHEYTDEMLNKIDDFLLQTGPGKLDLNITLKKLNTKYFV